jgi:hypothetical protein
MEQGHQTHNSIGRPFQFQVHAFNGLQMNRRHIYHHVDRIHVHINKRGFCAPRFYALKWRQEMHYAIQGCVCRSMISPCSAIFRRRAWKKKINISRDKIESSSKVYYELETFCQTNTQPSLLMRGLSDLRSGHGQTGGQIRRGQGCWLRPRYTLKLKKKKKKKKG